MAIGCWCLLWWVLEVGVWESAEVLHLLSDVVAFAGGQRQPSPKWDLKAEVPAMDLIWPTTLQADIRNIYKDVYQLRRLLGEIPCYDATAKKIHQSITESVKECLWHKQGHVQLPEQQDSASEPCSDSPLGLQHGAWALHGHIEPDSYEEVLVVAQDVHHQALIMAHLLEDHIEQLGWKVSHRQSCSCRWSYSHWCSHSHRHLKTHGRPLSASH